MASLTFRLPSALTPRFKHGNGGDPNSRLDRGT
jgi:hypothetical protein